MVQAEQQQEVGNKLFPEVKISPNVVAINPVEDIIFKFFQVTPYWSRDGSVK